MFTPQAAKPSASPVALDRRVLLICMPFQLIDNSPLAPALLGTILAEQGFPTNELYFHLEFARLLEFHVYSSAISDLNWLPELLFAEQMHDVPLPADTAAAMDARFGVRSVRDARFAAFAASCQQALAAQPVPDLVGFTTTFYQFIPSLWMAGQIRKLWPSAKLVFGGGRCDSPMGEAVHRLYPEIDYVIGGRGERLLLDLVRSDPWPASSFMFDREGAPLDTLPVVDYDAFITQINRVMPVDKRVAAFDEGRAYETRSPEEAQYWSHFDLKLNYESSKGCWYGEKVHCKFCGLGSNMKYSAKPASRTLREIDRLWDRYGQNLMATDAIISLDYFKELRPELATRQGKRPRLFYEIKANVTRAQVRLLREANVREIQPGIESLSSKHLRLMAKGVSAIQNIALLKWAREEGIGVNWNFLCGIPGETANDYLEIKKVLPHLVQLDPPTGLRQIRLDRYSPYFNRHQEFGWSKIQPNPIFRLLHPDLDDEETASIAWRFESVGTSTLAPVGDYYDETASAIADWQRRHLEGEGLFWHREHGLLRKRDGEIDQYEPTPTLVSIIEHTNTITTAANLMRECDVDDETVEGLVDDGILFREGDKLINLAVDRTSSRAAPPPAGAS
jgi:ribosomal peptide maturation radical SAM protein 1